jgi:exopolysaccharide biosynthesis protein
MRRRAAVVSAFVLWATPAAADSTKTTPVPGITHIHRWNIQVRSAMQDYHVVLAEIANPSLRFATSKHADRNHTTSWFGTTYGAYVAVNGSMFNTDFLPCGALQNGGAFWPGAWSGCNASLVLGPARAAIINNGGKLSGPWPTEAAFATDGVSGQPWLIRDGKSTAPWTAPGSINDRNARTAVGLTSTGKTMILVTVDSGRAGAQGMTGADLVLVLSEFAAYQAMYLDGTAAAAMWIGKEGGLQSVPSDAGKERTVSNSLMILPAIVAPPDAGPDVADAAMDATIDTAVADSMTTPLDAGSTGPEDPTGDAGEIADASIYEGPSEGLPTGLPGSPINSNATCGYNARGGGEWALLAIALLFVRTGTRRRA